MQSQQLQSEIVPHSGKASQSAFLLLSQRRRINVLGMFVCLLVPWILYLAVYALLSFYGFYSRPKLCTFFVTVCGLGTLAIGVAAALKVLKKVNLAPDYAPNWMVFLFLSCLAALSCGIVLGHLNFWTNMQPYYDYLELGEYSMVDPSRMRGQQFMDAGRIHWVPDVHVDVKRSMGFKNLDTYCVAPVTVNHNGTDAVLDSYDYWVVGLDCCTGNMADFHCGEFHSAGAKMGLRVLEDEHRSFYRLAIQQAEATYSIKARHPLLFYLVQDADAEMTYYRDMGYRYFMLGMILHFGWQLLCVLLAAYGFSSA